MVVSSTTRGAIQPLRVPLKSLGGRMGSYGGLHYHARDYTDTQGAAPWSLSGFRGSWVVCSAMPRCSLRYTSAYYYVRYVHF